jgi:hypothetical protein
MAFEFITKHFNKSAAAPHVKNVNDAFYDATLQNMNDKLLAFVQDLPREVGGIIDKKKVDEKTDSRIYFLPSNAVSLSDIRNSEGYKALHAFCSRPEVNICVEMRTNFDLDVPRHELEVNIMRPYSHSDDIKLMSKQLKSSKPETLKV